MEEEALNELMMRDSYLEREVPTSVEEEHDDVNEVDILGLTDDDIVFRVHNIEEMVCNIERHGDDDQYSNGKLAKYKKMIEDSKKSFYHSCVVQYTRLFVMVKLFQFKRSFYHGCVVQYMRLFMMVKLFQLKASNRWSDGSFMDLLTLLK
jgi:hypothetical protein